MISRLVLSLAALPLLSAPVFAQTASAADANALGGGAVPGLCMLSREAVLANSAAGKAATARLQQLTAEAQAEVAADRRPVDADLRAYQAEAAKLTPDQRRTREAALQARLTPIGDKARQRDREIKATRVKVVQQILAGAQPVIAQVYAARRCGLLVDRNSVIGGNMTNDLTADVVRGLDAKIPTITFNRETLPAESAAPR